MSIAARQPSRRIIGLAKWACAVFLVAMSSAASSLAAAAPVASRTAARQKTAFYVASHRWHTSIIVPRAAIPPGAWPPGVVERDFAGCRYLELGWGDRKFYPCPKPTVWMVFDALFVPGPSVLHVVGHSGPLADAHTWNSLLRVPCTRQELAEVCRLLGASFERDAQGRAHSMGTGLYGRKSQFYFAEGLYWGGNSCNKWTAQIMRAGGLPANLSLCKTLTAGSVMAQARRLTLAREQPPRGAAVR
jgi:uncharacterized protein (TIGR02117 family)